MRALEAFAGRVKLGVICIVLIVGFSWAQCETESVETSTPAPEATTETTPAPETTPETKPIPPVENSEVPKAEDKNEVPSLLSGHPTLRTHISALVNANGEAVDIETVFKKRWIMLYFGAKWSGPTREFTPQLLSYYNLKGGGKSFEIIFSSFDKTEQEMMEHMRGASMPWVAIPFGTTGGKFIQNRISGPGIPCIVVMDEHDNIVLTSEKEDHEVILKHLMNLTGEGDKALNKVGNSAPVETEEVKTTEDVTKDLLKQYWWALALAGILFAWLLVKACNRRVAGIRLPDYRLHLVRIEHVGANSPYTVEDDFIIVQGMSFDLRGASIEQEEPLVVRLSTGTILEFFKKKPIEDGF